MGGSADFVNQLALFVHRTASSEEAYGEFVQFVEQQLAARRASLGDRAAAADLARFDGLRDRILAGIQRTPQERLARLRTLQPQAALTRVYGGMPMALPPPCQGVAGHLTPPSPPTFNEAALLETGTF